MVKCARCGETKPDKMQALEAGWALRCFMGVWYWICPKHQ